MRVIPAVLSLSTLFGATAGVAQNQPKTEAEEDQLIGHVKSVVTTVSRNDVHWQQPGLPGAIIPVWCTDCEYDPEGNRTLQGNLDDGEFHGTLYSYIRDANGRVVSRDGTSVNPNVMTSHTIFGPYGKTEEFLYVDGKLQWHNLFTYDENGHMTDWLTLNPGGAQESRTQTRTAPDGTELERSTWDASGMLLYRSTNDPETHEERLTTYDHSGQIKLSAIFKNGQPASFWEATDSPNQYGQRWNEDRDNGDHDDFECHGGQCARTRVHTEYAGPGKHNPKSVEWRGEDGKLQRGTYYDYEFDSAGNWTKRRVSVWTPQLGDRTACETDTRKLTYWDR